MLQKVETLLNFQRIQDLCIIEILQLSSFTLNCKRLNWKYKYNSDIWTKIVMIVISLLLAEKIIMMTVNTRFGQYWQMTIKIWQLVGHKILFTITRTEVFIGCYTLTVDVQNFTLWFAIWTHNSVTVQISMYAMYYKYYILPHSTNVFLDRNKADKA